MSRHLAPILLVTVLSLPGTVQAHRVETQHVSPVKLVLQLADLPPGWTQTKAKASTPAQSDVANHMAPGTLERHGRLATYETDFQRAGLALVGLIAIQDIVDSYRAIAGAHWQFQFSVGQTPKSFNGARFHPMSVGRIGDEAVGYEWTGTSKGYRFTVFAVIFRRDVYAAFITGSSLANAGAPDDVIRLAHVIDNRIRQIH